MKKNLIIYLCTFILGGLSVAVFWYIDEHDASLERLTTESEKAEMIIRTQVEVN